jgi:hypothetical protein
MRAVTDRLVSKHQAARAKPLEPIRHRGADPRGEHGRTHASEQVLKQLVDAHLEGVLQRT